MLPQRDFSEIVMHRVRAVFVFRSLVFPLALELVAVGAFIGAVALSVSLKDVVANFSMILSSGSVFEYLYGAVAQTEIVMQVFMGLLVAVSVYFVYRFARIVLVRIRAAASPLQA